MEFKGIVTQERKEGMLGKELKIRLSDDKLKKEVVFEFPLKPGLDLNNLSKLKLYDEITVKVSLRS